MVSKRALQRNKYNPAGARDSDTGTQIPSSNQYTYTLMGNKILDIFM